MSKQVLIMPVPPNTRGVYSIGALSGPMDFTLTGNDAIFAFQWTTPNHFAILDYLSVSAAVSGAITTGVVMGVELMFARDFTQIIQTPSGNILTPSFSSAISNNQKLKTDFLTSLVTDLRIANEQPLDVGSFQPDAYALGQVIFGTGTAVGTTALAQTILYDRATNGFPVVINTNEGFLLTIPDGITGYASGSIRFSVNARWLETAKGVF